jgi:transposase
MHFNLQSHALIGSKGSLPVSQRDEISLKLMMLVEGECEGLGPTKAARKFGFSKQRYYQLRDAYRREGAEALQSKRRGPKSNYRRTDELVRQVIRHRFLDPEVSPDVIAQKLRQTGFEISTRSVERVIAEYGLQKKTLSVSSD